MKRIAIACTVWLALGAVYADEPAVTRPAASIDVERAHEKEWEILFDDDISPEEYARQLDYFGIEIAAISRSGRVEYITKLTERRPEKRVGHQSEDPRRWIGWKSGVLRAVDRRLLRKAGITSGGKELTHYFPPEVQQQMEALEIEFAGRKESEIELTRFQIQPSDEQAQGYRFVVIDQQPPPEAE